MDKGNTGRLSVTGPPVKNCNGVSYIVRPGAGPTVVFLHGIGSNAMSFAPLFQSLPQDWNLLAWNAPGYGASEPLQAFWPAPLDYAQRLDAWIKDLDLTQIHLVGHSLGTLMAAAYAKVSVDRLSSLMLVSAANGYGIPRDGVMPDKVAARITDLERQGPQAFAQARAARLVHDPSAHPDVVAHVAAGMAQVDPAGYAQAVRMLASGDLAGDLADVTIRPGFIIGSQDQITPVTQTQKAAAGWRPDVSTRPQIISIDGTGHAVYLQKPADFSAALSRLMSQDRVTAQHHEDV